MNCSQKEHRQKMNFNDAGTQLYLMRIPHRQYTVVKHIAKQKRMSLNLFLNQLVATVIESEGSKIKQ